LTSARFAPGLSPNEIIRIYKEIWIMKYKMMAVVLALTVMSWAQTATQTTPPAPQQSTEPAEKAKCPCCDKMAAVGTKDTHACCAHHGKHASDEKGMGSCCAGKDAKSCMRSEKDAAAGSCCKDGCSKESCEKDKTASACCGGSCGKDGEKGCCSSKNPEKTVKTCCDDDLRGQDETLHTFAQVGK
jgi:hypothetical protein